MLGCSIAAFLSSNRAFVFSTICAMFSARRTFSQSPPRYPTKSSGTVPGFSRLAQAWRAPSGWPRRAPRPWNGMTGIFARAVTQPAKLPPPERRSLPANPLQRAYLLLRCMSVVMALPGPWGGSVCVFAGSRSSVSAYAPRLALEKRLIRLGPRPSRGAGSSRDF